MPDPEGDVTQAAEDRDWAPWNTLTSPEKRARVLTVAGELFAREGVNFPMPELARAVGVGVGSLYRQVGDKDDVLTELVIERLQRFLASFEAARGTGEPVEVLLKVVRQTLTETLQDRVAKMSFELALERDDVREIRQRAAAALQALVDDARATGGLRDDASVMDIRILFRLAREAERITPGGGKRVAELMVAGLRCQTCVPQGQEFIFETPPGLHVDRSPTAI